VGEEVVDCGSLPLPQILAENLEGKEVDEGRKRTIGIIATIFACRKLAALEGKPSPAREMAFSRQYRFGCAWRIVILPTTGRECYMPCLA
jgi:hypothetical protein